MKECRRCGETVALDAFPVDKAKRDGRGSYCKPCRSAYYAEYRARPGNAEKIDARSREWAKAHPEVAGRRHRTPQARAYRRRYYEANRERCSSANRRRYAANPEPIRARTRRWREENPERHQDYVKARKARKRGASRTEHVISRKVYERDGYVCWLCEEPTEPQGVYARRPSVDHVVPLVLGGEHTYDNARTAHRGCNSAKGASLVLVA